MALGRAMSEKFLGHEKAPLPQKQGDSEAPEMFVVRSKSKKPKSPHLNDPPNSHEIQG